MGEVIQLQGDQRKDVQEFLVDKKEGLGLDSKDIKVSFVLYEWKLRKLTHSRSTVSSRLPLSRRARQGPAEYECIKVGPALRVRVFVLATKGA